ncbi:hypothetical protein EHS25_005636 [Saitozyma podzolica]|uniref:HD domain-containing protein n=1 Tax=Saitozyma podzolica TaxID=1890683 RepID=A0A427XY37_9TREE|nr:hypothetical protein EHS25_005636 [Saitozyma podzolica]
MFQIDAKVDEIFAMLARGSAKYENNAERSVSQLEHALQCGQLAVEAGETDETIVGALLHDIGHYLPHVEAVELINDNLPRSSRRSHDVVGYVYLGKMGFPESVTELVNAHVDAKRYLTATDPTYYDQLSKGSKNSLRMQGGPFTPEQVTKFEKNPFFREAVNVRIYDDKAKVVDYNTRTLESFKPIVHRVLAAHAWI